MGRFVTSPTAAAATNLQEFLLNREKQRRTEMLDQITQQEHIARMEAAKVAQVRAAQEQQQQDADRLARIVSPETDLTGAQADQLSRGGYQVGQRNTIAAKTIAMPTGADGPMIASQDLAPEAYGAQRRGETFAETLARQAREGVESNRIAEREARVDAAKAERIARADQAAKDRESREGIALDNAELRRDVAASNRSARLAITPTSEAAMINRLQTQWDKANASQREMVKQASIMQTGLDRFAQDPNGGSQAVLITFQKILDPSSVVRESEYARSAEGTALMNRMEGYMEKLQRGGAGVTQADLASMAATARAFTQNLANHNRGIRQRAERTADRYGIPHDLVFDDDGGDQGGGNSGSSAPAPRVRRYNPATGKVE